MIKRYYEHSFDISLISAGGWGIDFGCGTDFYISKTMLDFGLKVIAVDPNPRIQSVLDSPDLFYENAALVSSETQIAEFSLYNDTDAASFCQPKNDVFFLKKEETIKVATITLDKIMKKYGVEQFEILKLDIEGAEYDFLMSIEGPVAKQISIEFHDFRGLNPCYPDNELYYQKLFEKLSRWYKISKHNVEKHPGLSPPYCYNYWDSLLTLK